MGIRVISDSSSNLFAVEGIDYKTVPLKVMFDSREYVDEPGTDVEQMVLQLQEHDGPSTTSCPNVQEWLDAFEGADEVCAVTISSGLSASFEAAQIAAAQYLAANPGAKAHVFDSKATGPVLRLIIERLRDGIVAGKTFEQVVADTLEYQQGIRILYSLESLNNLARNGRVSMRLAHIAAALNIRAIGHASEEGKVELLHKCRGERRALKTLVREMEERGFAGGAVHIDHCLNRPAAESLADLILKHFPLASVHVHPCTALCSYYADKGGLIIGYEV